jgi:glycosyltransferase involved in cell wall biosynthesis
MNNVIVSLITVCYNSEKTIERTIESVINQSYKNIEYIIIDGLSNDNTLGIIKDYAIKNKNIKYISEEDSGIYDAMNKGIEMSSGEIIGIVNSDDWYELDAVENILSAYEKTGEGVYYGLLRTIFHEKELAIERVHHDFIGEKIIPHPTCFVNKSIYEKYGQFDIRYKSAADLNFLIRLKAKNVPFYSLDFILTNFRIGGMSSSIQGAIDSLKVKRDNNIIPVKQFYIKYFELKVKHFLKNLLSYGK